MKRIVFLVPWVATYFFVIGVTRIGDPDYWSGACLVVASVALILARIKLGLDNLTDP